MQTTDISQNSHVWTFGKIPRKPIRSYNTETIKCPYWATWAHHRLSAGSSPNTEIVENLRKTLMEKFGKRNGNILIGWMKTYWSDYTRWFFIEDLADIVDFVQSDLIAAYSEGFVEEPYVQNDPDVTFEDNNIQGKMVIPSKLFYNLMEQKIQTAEAQSVYRQCMQNQSYKRQVLQDDTDYILCNLVDWDTLEREYESVVESIMDSVSVEVETPHVSFCGEVFTQIRRLANKGIEEQEENFSTEVTPIVKGNLIGLFQFLSNNKILQNAQSVSDILDNEEGAAQIDSTVEHIVFQIFRFIVDNLPQVMQDAIGSEAEDLVNERGSFEGGGVDTSEIVSNLRCIDFSEIVREAVIKDNPDMVEIIRKMIEAYVKNESN